ncbi:MAG: hypothetical protein P8Y93_04575 [Acidobacteriota bacterium]
MNVRTAVVMIVVVVITASFTWGGDDNKRGKVAVEATAAPVAVSAGSRRTVEPWIHHKMDPKVRAKLEDAFALALERVRTRRSCAVLFARLGADGTEILKTGLYLPVPDYFQEFVACGRDPAANSRVGSTLAYAKVGGSPTWICRHFSLISTETAAVVIIHEALHHSGLDERPHERMAMSSMEISEMVRNACDL